MKHIPSYLQEVGICSLLELFIYISYKSPMGSFGEIIFYPLFARPEATSSFEGMVFSLYALVLCWASEFLDAFFTLSLDLEHDFQILSLFYSIVTPDILEEGFGDWWDLVFPYVIAIHYVHAVAVCGFIALSIHCGLAIQHSLPALEVSYSQFFLFVRICSARIWWLLSLSGKLVSLGQFALSLLLDWLLPVKPASLIAASTGLIIVDTLLAIWTAKAIIPVFLNVQIMGSTMLSGIADNNTGSGWSPIDDMDGKDWKYRAMEWLYAAVRSYFEGLVQWYDSTYEEDELRHYPFLTIPITVFIVSIACKLLWEDKPRHLVQHEHIIEETFLKNAVIQDFESHLRNSMSDKGEFVQVLGLLADTITEHKKLLNENKSLNGEMEKLQGRESTLNHRLQSYRTENIALSGENRGLKEEVDELRLLSDVKVNRENTQALKDQLAASKEESASLHRQKAELERQLKSTRDAKLAAEARAAAAEEAEKNCAIEGSNLRHAIDRLSQENTNLQHTYQQLANEYQTMVQAKTVAEETTTNHAVMIDSLGKANHAAEEAFQQLQTKLAEAEARSIATRHAAETAVRSLQTEVDDLRVQHSSRATELDTAKAREDHMKRENMKRVTQLRKAHRLGQKKLKNTFILNQKRLNEDLEAVRKDNQRLEHQIVKLDDSLQGQTQVIHDPHKNKEIEQLKHQLQQQRSETVRLGVIAEQLEEENEKLKKQASSQPSLSSSQSESPQVVTLRNELKNKEEELQRLRIQLSNAQLSRRGRGGTSSPFMSPRRGR